MAWRTRLIVEDDKGEPVIQASWAMSNDEAVHMWNFAKEAIDDELERWLEYVR